jgi:glycerol-1-phosphate dehydrogenase [NAD(P)+]
VVGADAFDRLAARGREERWPGALAVMDANTEEAVGAPLAAALERAGVSMTRFVFPQRSGLLADPGTVGAVRAQLADDVEVLAAGSGVITDSVRYACHLSGRDFVSVPTAASMDGYASSLAALQVRGVKVTYPARAPRAIFADPAVAAAAPAELTRAGIGDLLGKATARVDWLAAHLLYAEPYDAAVLERMLVPVSFVADSVPELLSGRIDAAAALLDGLVQAGIAMAIAGSSRPASGCEHHASHFWDLLAARGLRPHASHGLQVGYATHFAMRLQRFAFGGGVSELRTPAPAADPLGEPARAWLGEPTDEMREAVEEKQRLLATVPASWPVTPTAWQEVRAGLAPALGMFDRVEKALDQAGIPGEPGYLGLDERILQATFRYATRLRARYTTVDFLETQGMLESGISAALSAPAGSGR